MTLRDLVPRSAAGRAAVLAIVASGGIGFAVARPTVPGGPSSPSSVASDAAGKPKPLYYYDPMVPQEHYDNPDSLSSMA